MKQYPTEGKRKEKSLHVLSAIVHMAHGVYDIRERYKQKSRCMSSVLSFIWHMGFMIYLKQYSYQCSSISSSFLHRVVNLERKQLFFYISEQHGFNSSGKQTC